MYEDPRTGNNSRVFCCGDGYSYYVNKVTFWDNEKRFNLRCMNYRLYNCGGTSTIVENETGRTWENKNRHTCTPDHDRHNVRLLRHDVRNLCRRSQYESPRQLLNRVAVRYPVTAAARVRLGAFRFSMRRARLRQYPNIPTTLTSLGNLLSSPEYQYLSNTLGTNNVYSGTVGEPGEKCVVFISQRMKQYLTSVKEVYADATFASTPALPLAQQIYQIVTVVLHHIIPLVVLMERKTYSSYRSILLHLQQVAPAFQPERVRCDFEEKKHQRAWIDAYRCKVVCYVHFCRAVLKRTGELGIKRVMNRNTQVQKIVQSMLGIPLLPRHLMHRGFRVLIEWAMREDLLL